MKHLFLLIAACIATVAQAQDVIVKRDGSTIISKVLEVNQADIKYKKFSNQQGPTYTINKSEVMAINYESGDKDTFEDAPQPAKQEADDKPEIIVAQPAADNAEIISRYNQTYEHGEAIKDNDKQADAGLCILGISENSTLSTDDIVIEFRQDPYISGEGRLGYTYNLLNRFYIQIQNKTDRIIYVDLGSTFCIKKGGTSKVYYNNSQTTITKGESSGTGVSLGAIASAVGIGGTLRSLANGVSFGGANMTSSTTTYAKQRIISIPPHGTIPIEKYHVEFLGHNRIELISKGETLLFGYKSGELPNIKYGELYLYSELDSPFHTDYIITYSKDIDFSNTFVAKASIYMRELIGAKPYMRNFWDVEWWSDRSDPQKQIERMKKRIPKYNDYTIVGTFGYKKNALTK